MPVIWDAVALMWRQFNRIRFDKLELVSLFAISIDVGIKTKLCKCNTHVLIQQVNYLMAFPDNLLGWTDAAPLSQYERPFIDWLWSPIDQNASYAQSQLIASKLFKMMENLSDN